MLAYSFQGKKIYPTRSYLRAFYRQAATNFDYSFIKFEEKVPAYSIISAYLFIRKLKNSVLANLKELIGFLQLFLMEKADRKSKLPKITNRFYEYL